MKKFTAADAAKEIADKYFGGNEVIQAHIRAIIWRIDTSHKPSESVRAAAEKAYQSVVGVLQNYDPDGLTDIEKDAAAIDIIEQAIDASHEYTGQTHEFLDEMGIATNEPRPELFRRVEKLFEMYQRELKHRIAHQPPADSATVAGKLDEIAEKAVGDLEMYFNVSSGTFDPPATLAKMKFTIASACEEYGGDVAAAVSGRRAAEIADLKAEVARLRGALEDCVQVWDNVLATSPERQDKVFGAARAALAPQEGQHE